MDYPGSPPPRSGKWGVPAPPCRKVWPKASLGEEDGDPQLDEDTPPPGPPPHNYYGLAAYGMSPGAGAVSQGERNPCKTRGLGQQQLAPCSILHPPPAQKELSECSSPCRSQCQSPTPRKCSHSFLEEADSTKLERRHHAKHHRRDRGEVNVLWMG